MERLAGMEATYTRTPRCAFILNSIVIERDCTVTADTDADLAILRTLEAEGLITKMDGEAQAGNAENSTSAEPVPEGTPEPVPEEVPTTVSEPAPEPIPPTTEAIPEVIPPTPAPASTSEEELCGALEEELEAVSEELDAGTSCLATPAAANSGA